ncbi:MULTISPECIES: hypothetical protein [unclassified Microcoleus]|uniref:hypothetical protein n=1 Tax=unclassified Microcoleus TaxID=2642155 RepID=UPI002FD17C19
MIEKEEGRRKREEGRRKKIRRRLKPPVIQPAHHPGFVCVDAVETAESLKY